MAKKGIIFLKFKGIQNHTISIDTQINRAFAEFKFRSLLKRS